MAAAKGRPSVLPKILEPIRRRRRVAHGALDRAMPQVRLDGPRVRLVGGKLEAAAMAKHVAVDQETEACGLASPGKRRARQDHLQLEWRSG